MNLTKCPFCTNDLEDFKHRPDNDSSWFQCKNCGKYTVSGSLIAEISSISGHRINAAIVSHYIRKAQGKKEPPGITTYLRDEILANQKIPTPHEQADNLILWLGKQLGTLGETLTLDSASLQAIMGAASVPGAEQVLSHLHNEGLIAGGRVGNPLNITSGFLSFSGWERFYKLEKGTADSSKAFMAMKFDKPELEKIFEDHFKPAVYLTGFDLRTVRDHPKAGLIDDRIKVEIRTSKFLIADLTHENPGAYWEAGYAEGLGKPVIYTCERSVWEEKQTHFDTNHYHTVIWEKEKPEEAADSLKVTIRATLPGEAKLEDD